MKKLLKRIFMTAWFCSGAVMLHAVPALQGAWRMITLADGTQIRVELRGDEHAHYWMDAEGNGYNLDGSTGVYRKVDVKKLLFMGQEKRKQANQLRVARMDGMRKAATRAGQQTSYVGKKKAIIILVQFTDTKFMLGHDQNFYNRVANEVGFSSNLGFKGSVKDYFLAQSNGQFELDFDVVGPYQLRHETAYYGGNDANGSDKRPGAMVAEACQAADEDVDFGDYDWDGNGYVDQVYVLYAGKGEAAGGDENTIWPHEFNLSSSDYGRSYVTKDNGIAVNTYACGSEMTLYHTPLGYRTRIDGIGTLCHEFSHCLGYPDLYDVNYDGNFGMGTWDLMSGGSYNGNSFCPPNFSAYEKWFAGWIEPMVLDKPATIKGMSPQAMRYGEAFVIYNDAHKDEYYLIENRQKSADFWDSGLAGSGLMITHVDYNKDIWEHNNVNTIVNYSDTYGEQYAYLNNDHQRLTIFHADNETKKEAGDLYPYEGNNSLTDTSTPSAILYNVGKTMGKPITNITQNADGTIDFDFMGGSASNIITGIESLPSTSKHSDDRIYSIEGKYVGRDVEQTGQGIYITNGKKYIQK